MVEFSMLTNPKDFILLCLCRKTRHFVLIVIVLNVFGGEGIFFKRKFPQLVFGTMNKLRDTQI